ncbi:MAG: DUF1634 domain-containing protein [Proteobacteria bacterium]|nr:DUF1634 domain-containing protein [Pseudomonadota bacterium]
MDEQQKESAQPMPYQIRYANILSIGAWLGILLMLITYFIYITGILSPHVDVMVITQNWDKGVDEYLRITRSPHGWGWLTLLHKADFLNFIGLVLLANLTIICYLFLIAGFKKTKDWPYFVISLLEVAVLALAASGILGTGGH